MLYLDITHSSHSPAQTGIQQVTRGLWNCLARSESAEAIVYDRYARAWRPLDRREQRHLAQVDQRKSTRRKRPHWSHWQRLRGRFQHGLAPLRPRTDLPAASGLIVPEFYDDNVLAALPRIRRLAFGRDVAVFHDAIAFEHPEWGVPETVKRYPAYLRSLADFSGIACVSEFSRQQLLRAWQALGVTSSAELRTIPLGLRCDHLPREAFSRPTKPSATLPRILCVSTVEPRKNQESLLAAAALLWEAGVRFELEFIGMLNRGFQSHFPERLASLQAAGRAVSWRGAVSSSALREAYQQADLSVYPSLCEGFGLPVYESLYFGTPVLSSSGGALAEVPKDAGCLTVSPDPGSLADALHSLLNEQQRFQRLKTQAQNARLRTLDAFACELVDFLRSLPAR